MVLSYLIDIIILLLAAVIMVPITQSLKLGSVPGFLLAGILVGPAILGVVNNVEDISHLSEIGVILLLFIIGVELRPTRLWLMRRLVFGLGTLQVVITGFAISLVAYYLFKVSLAESILIGPALALSSTAFVLQLLLERQSLATHYGRTSVAILLLQDLAVIPLITLVPLLASPHMNVGMDIGIALFQAVVILAIVIVSGRYCLQPILHRIAMTGNSDIFTAFSILLVIGMALLTEEIGLSMGLGAFIAGLLISDSSYRHQMKAEIQPFRGLLLGLFFMSMGMSINLKLFYEMPLTLIGITALLILIKILVLVPIAYFFEIRKRNQFAVALILAQGGEFALVLFAMAHESGLMGHATFEYLLLVILLSMLATPLLAGLADRLVNQAKREQPHAKTPKPDGEGVAIIIAGYGRVGRRIGEILKLSGKKFVAIDLNPAVVQVESQKGIPIFFGDVRNPEVLKSANVTEAKAIVVTVNDELVSLDLVSALRHRNLDVPIYARGHSMTQCIKLKKAGANGVVSENVEASLELASLALEKVDITPDDREKLIDDFRIQYREQIDNAVKSD